MEKKQLYIRLKELREEHNLSQMDVAQYLNISRQSISQWELGKSSPDIDNLVLLSRLYNISLDELVTGEDKTSNSEVQEARGEEKNEKEKTFEVLCLTITIDF